MKKTLFGAVIIFACSIGASVTNATVGGPTYISSIQTDSKNQDIVYEVANQNGRGCPPELYSYNLISRQTKVLLSCNDLEKLNQQDQMLEMELALSKYPQVFKHIDINRNQITAVSTVTGYEKYDETKGHFGKTDFSVDIFQNNIKKATFTYQGCKPDQQQLIDGYTIPNTNYLVIVISTKGDCFEGGYTMQRLFVVPEVTIFDTKYIPISMNIEPVSGNGNITLVASNASDFAEKIENTETSPKPSETGQIMNDNQVATSTSSSPTLIYQIFIALLLIIIIVLIVKRK